MPPDQLRILAAPPGSQAPARQYPCDQTLLAWRLHETDFGKPFLG